MSLQIREILESSGLKLKDCGNTFRCRPPYRNSGNDTSLLINKEDGSWFDFSWGRGGKFPELLKLLGLKDIDLDGLEIIPKNYAEEPLEGEKTFNPAIIHELCKDHSYWVGRGVTEATVREFGGGVDLQWKLKNRYVFPVFNGHNKIVGLFGRDLTNNPKVPKYKILGRKKEFRWPLFLNHSLIQEKGEAILVESPACVLKLWDCGIRNVVCLFGIEISPSLIGLLIRYNLKSIIIATNNEPDNDSVGNKAAEKIKSALLNYFDPSNVKIKLPTKKDFAEMPCEEIYQWNKC